MKIFLDSSKLEEIEKAKSFGILEGVTTNPSLVKKAVEGKKVDMKSYITKILKTCKGIPVSLEVIGDTYEEMVAEGRKLFKMFNPVAKNVYIKIPVSPIFEKTEDTVFDGIKAIKTLSKEKIPVNCTLIFTPEQALLAADAGAKFVSPFVGREDDYLRNKAHMKFKKTDYFPAKGIKNLDDGGIVSGVDLIKKISEIFKEHEIKSEILAASIRNHREVREVAAAGADIATISLKVMKELLLHPKTMEGMKGFTKDIVPEYKELMQ